MKIEGNYKNKESVVDSAQTQGSERMERPGKNCFVCVQEASDKAYKSKQDICPRCSCLHNAHEKKCKENYCAQKWRNTEDIHMCNREITICYCVAQGNSSFVIDYFRKYAIN